LGVKEGLTEKLLLRIGTRSTLGCYRCRHVCVSEMPDRCLVILKVLSLRT